MEANMELHNLIILDYIQDFNHRKPNLNNIPQPNKMADKTENKNLILGIDLGTTSVKVTLLESASKNVLMSLREDTKANVILDKNIACQHFEQNVNLIFAALHRTLSRFPKELMSRVLKIGVCGQMHGCVFWKRDHKKSSVNNLDEKFKNDCRDLSSISHLITWEDQRCSEEFISSLPASGKSLPLSTGFGCATIFWLSRNNPCFLSSYDCSGTVQDLLVAMLCGLSKPVMSTQNAHSWGCYDMSQKRWEINMLEHAGFPIDLLPEVREPGTIAGVLPMSYYAIPTGTHVGVALGDLQCSVLASLEHKTDAVLNIGTSSQLAVTISFNQMFSYKSVSASIQFWPFFKDEVIAVAASLTGGNALATFVETLQNWMKELEISTVPNKEELYTKLLKCASGKTSTALNIRPTLWGERHNTTLTGNVSHLSESNISLGDVTASLCNGVINNLQTLMPKEWLISCGIKRILGSGNGLAKNIILQEQTEKIWGLPLVMKDDTDASLGAALALI